MKQKRKQSEREYMMDAVSRVIDALPETIDDIERCHQILDTAKEVLSLYALNPRTGFKRENNGLRPPPKRL